MTRNGRREAGGRKGRKMKDEEGRMNDEGGRMKANLSRRSLDGEDGRKKKDFMR